MKKIIRREGKVQEANYFAGKGNKKVINGQLQRGYRKKYFINKRR